MARNSELSPKELQHQSEKEERVQVSGILKMADSRKKGTDQIEIIDTSNTHHTIIVPSGMMSDIVKPLWERQVLVTGIRQGKKINLRDIQPLDSKDHDSP